MKHVICLVLSGIHLLAMAISTYLASWDIESIIVTSFICSFTGFIAGSCSLACRRKTLATACFVAPLLAVALWTLEGTFLHLGPERAAVPFTILFLANQAITLPVMLVQMRLLLEPNGQAQRQITLRTMMFSVTVFAICSAIAKSLLQKEDHDWLMTVALGLVGLTITGICLVIYTAIKNRCGQTTAADTAAQLDPPSRGDAEASPFDD